MNTHNMFYGEIQIFYANMLINHQMPSLSVSLDQIQKISKIDSIYLFIYLFIKKEKLYNIKCTF